MWFTHYSQLGLLKGASEDVTATLNSADVTLIWNKDIGDGYTAIELMRMMSAVLLGKNSGLTETGGTTPYLSIDGSKARVTGTVDKYGNRTNVDLDGT